MLGDFRQSIDVLLVSGDWAICQQGWTDIGLQVAGALPRSEFDGLRLLRLIPCIFQISLLKLKVALIPIC